MTNNKTVRTIIKSYIIAFFGCLVFTSINAVIDYNNPYVTDSLNEIVRFHFLSALGYAIPVSAVVFFVIRNPSREIRIQKVLRVFTYLALVFIGGFIGNLLALQFFMSDSGTGELDDIMVWSFSIMIGAVVLPTVFFLYSLYSRKNNQPPK